MGRCDICLHAQPIDSTYHDRICEDGLRDVCSILDERWKAGHASEDLLSCGDIARLERKGFPRAYTRRRQVLRKASQRKNSVA